nr:integrase, catalytic region, zinc finger, CCHC-type, peptidase aspartic, catalytic [Tanacetum cinerariifolium]
MDSIIPLGQKNTLAEYMIFFGADNHPPMLDKDLHDSWKSKMELYMQNREHRRMILESIENDTLIWPTVKENRVTRTTKYAELSNGEKIQADCDMKATNNILQEMLAEAKEAGQVLGEEKLTFLADLGVSDGQVVQNIILNNATFQTEDLDTYDSDCDDVSNAKMVLMANISNYAYDIISEEKANNEYNNESVTAELERYKERVKTFEQRLNVDLSSLQKIIDSQMDDMIKEKLVLKEKVDSLEQNLSNQIKENECLLQPFTIFKSESKAKEDKYMENKIDLEKKIKELDNFIFKVGQSAHTVYMLTKPQAFYDNIHKQALKTLILEEVSRSKMAEKEKDPKAIKGKNSNKPIDYVKLNKIHEDFGKRFVPQQELSADEAFWYHMLNPSTKFSNALPLKIEAPKELPKDSLIRTTPNARIKGELGFKHTKAIFNNEIIPFLKSLKDIFNVFDKELLNEIMEVQIVLTKWTLLFNSLQLTNNVWKLQKKNYFWKLIDILHQIMSQDFRLTVMNSMSLIGESMNMERKRNKSCDKYFNLNAKLLKSQNAHNDLLKRIFSNNDLKAQLQDKDTTICKLKEIIKSMREKSKDENVNYDYCEIETKNLELENSVAKLLSENERLCKEINHVKHIFKEQFDSIKKTRMFKLDLVPLAPKLLQNSRAHIDYLKYTQEQVDILRGIVKQAKAKQPLDNALDFVCSPDCSLVSGLRMFKTYDRELLSAHELCFLRSKDEAPESIIKCIKNIQVRLNSTIRNVRTDNGTEFTNQTLRNFFENVGISHQTSVARAPQQNGVVERQNQSLVEVARTMLIFSKAPLLL